jgi:hypothetical protein
MYGFALRMYDQRLGRWHATDPYEQHWSPYLAPKQHPFVLSVGLLDKGMQRYRPVPIYFFKTTFIQD